MLIWVHVLFQGGKKDKNLCFIFEVFDYSMYSIQTSDLILPVYWNNINLNVIHVISKWDPREGK